MQCVSAALFYQYLTRPRSRDRFMATLLRDRFIVCEPCVFFHFGSLLCVHLCVRRALFVLLLARCELWISLGARSPAQIQITSLIRVVIRPEQAGAQAPQQ